MNEKERKLLTALYILVAFTIPFPPNINSPAIIIFSVFSIWLSNKYKSHNRVYFHFFWANILFSIIFVIGFFYTANIHSGLRLFETRISLIAFPILVLVSGDFWDRTVIRTVLVSFAIVTVACGFFIQGQLLLFLLDQGRPFADFFDWHVSGSDLSERMDIHPAYLSMYSVFAVAVIYEFFVRGKRISTRAVFAYLLIVYLIVLTLHLSSRTSLVVLAAVLALVCFDFIRQYRLKAWLMIVPVLFLVGWLFSLNKFSIKSRLENNIGLNIDFFLHDKMPGDSIYKDHRVYAWYSSIKLSKKNFFIGVGSGDADDSLAPYYKKLNVGEFANIQLNSHNQYFDAIIRNGVLGLISLLLCYIFGACKTGFRRLYLIFVIIIATNSITENILNRQKGVVFFAVFNSLLFTYYRRRDG